MSGVDSRWGIGVPRVIEFADTVSVTAGESDLFRLTQSERDVLEAFLDAGSLAEVEWDGVKRDKVKKVLARVEELVA
jgi:hypothetical protein